MLVLVVLVPLQVFVLVTADYTVCDQANVVAADVFVNVVALVWSCWCRRIPSCPMPYGIAR